MNAQALAQDRRWCLVEAADPDPVALIRGADGCARVVNARIVAQLDATCRILKAAGVKVELLPPLLDGAYPAEFD